jgi:alpha-tubulin suppressor-like RCC1 family protein
MTGSSDLEFVNSVKADFQGSPANVPCIVEDLFALPDKVIMISSGGTLTAALTSGNDIYMWGTGVTPGPLTQLWNASPFPLDLDGHDFLDVAIGNQHVIVLTTEHRVFVLGDNRSGQLGLGETLQCDQWTEVSLPIVGEKQHVTKVYAGHNNSVLLVEDITE